MVSVAQEWRPPLAPSATVLPLGRLNLDSVVTNNPSCVEPGNSLSPNPQPLLPLSQAVQDEWPPPFVLNSSGLPSVSLEKTPYTCSALSLFLSCPLSLSAFPPGLTGTLISHEKLVPWYLMTFLSYSHD
jgi:hypothetical protein